MCAIDRFLHATQALFLAKQILLYGEGLEYSTALSECHFVRDYGYLAIGIWKHWTLNQIANGLQSAKVLFHQTSNIPYLPKVLLPTFCTIWYNKSNTYIYRISWELSAANIFVKVMPYNKGN